MTILFIFLFQLTIAQIALIIEEKNVIYKKKRDLKRPFLGKKDLPKKRAELVLFVVGLSIFRPSLSSKALERSNRTALSLMWGVG